MVDSAVISLFLPGFVVTELSGTLMGMLLILRQLESSLKFEARIDDFLGEASIEFSAEPIIEDRCERLLSSAFFCRLERFLYACILEKELRCSFFIRSVSSGN